MASGKLNHLPSFSQYSSSYVLSNAPRSLVARGEKRSSGWDPGEMWDPSHFCPLGSVNSSVSATTDPYHQSFLTQLPWSPRQSVVSSKMARGRSFYPQKKNTYYCRKKAGCQTAVSPTGYYWTLGLCASASYRRVLENSHHCDLS